jgi:FtsZ-interacting cell division protein ZipA
VSQLQLGLLAIGALVITSVLVYNWWQERSIRRDMVRRFDGPIDDVLMGNKAAADPEADDAFAMDVAEEAADDEGFEPAIEDEPDVPDELETEPEWEEPEFTASEPDEIEIEENEPEITLPSIEDTIEEREPEPILLQEEEEAEAFEPLAAEETEEFEEDIPSLITSSSIEDSAPEPAPSLIPPATPLPAGVDSQIDEIAIVSIDSAMTGEALRELLSTVADFGKPVRWFGASGAEWLPLTKEYASRNFSTVVGALQLADRSGAVQAKGLRDFQDQIDELGQQTGGQLAWQEQRDALQYAQALDQFCIDVDVTVTLHLAAGISGPFAGTKFRSLMEASGLTLKDDGRFHSSNAEGETMFTICNADQRPLSEEGLRTSSLHDVVLMLDVPRVGDANNVFKQMAMLGNRMETALNAKLTDARQRALGDAEIEQIRSQIKAIHAKMQERQLVPGSASVLRLFS